MTRAGPDRDKISGCAIGTLVFLLAATLAAQLPPKPETVVELRLEPPQLQTRDRQRAMTTLVATIREGFHINSNQPLQDYLIPTRVELVEAAQFELEKVDYPAGELKSFEFAPDEQLSVYEGAVRLPLQLLVKPGTPSGSHTLQVRLHYQACNDKICLRPTQKQIALPVTVTVSAGRAAALPR